MSDRKIEWPPTDRALAREASNVVAQIELDMRVQRASQSDEYALPYALFGRLLAIGLPVVPGELFEFLDAANELAVVLPGPAGEILKKLLGLSIDDGPDGIGAVYRLFWEARWQGFGCPAVNLDARLAASLMVSETPPELLEDLLSPWPCFVVRLPAGLVMCGGEEYTHCVVHRLAKGPLPREPSLDDVPLEHHATMEKVARFAAEQAGVKWGIYSMVGTRGSWQEEGRLAELMGREEKVQLVEPEFEQDGPQRRVIGLLARLAAGICLAAETPGTLRPKSTKKDRQHWRLSKAPTTTEYVLAPDVKITFDATEAVRSYIQGDRRKLPVLQWIVRGHWRNQACGPSLAQRKRLWIQPYWKGPADAPRMFREYSLAQTGKDK